MKYEYKIMLVYADPYVENKYNRMIIGSDIPKSKHTFEKEHIKLLQNCSIISYEQIKGDEIKCITCIKDLKDLKTDTHYVTIIKDDKYTCAYVIPYDRDKYDGIFLPANLFEFDRFMLQQFEEMLHKFGFNVFFKLTNK